MKFRGVGRGIVKREAPLSLTSPFFRWVGRRVRLNATSDWNFLEIGTILDYVSDDEPTFEVKVDDEYKRGVSDDGIRHVPLSHIVLTDDYDMEMRIMKKQEIAKEAIRSFAAIVQDILTKSEIVPTKDELMFAVAKKLLEENNV